MDSSTESRKNISLKLSGWIFDSLFHRKSFGAQERNFLSSNITSWNVNTGSYEDQENISDPKRASFRSIYIVFFFIDVPQISLFYSVAFQSESITGKTKFIMAECHTYFINSKMPFFSLPFVHPLAFERAQRNDDFCRHTRRVTNIFFLIKPFEISF